MPTEAEEHAIMVAGLAVRVSQHAKQGDVQALINDLALSEESKQVIPRLGALVYLGRLRAKESVPDVITALSDPRYEVRATASQTLGVLKARAAESALTDALADPESGVRFRAAQALIHLNPLSLRSRNVLLDRLADQDRWVVAMSSRALLESHDPEDAAAVLRALRGKPGWHAWNLRRKARGLASHGAEEA